MPERIPEIFLYDMLFCVQKIITFTHHHDFETFLSDEKTKDAVLRNLGVLGEAANRVPKPLREKYTQIEWGRIIRSRNVIIHDYEIIDYNVIWRIVTVHLPPLETFLKEIIEGLEKP